MFKKILIANRGEIALRIIRACKEMGIKTVAIHSEIDKDCLHVRNADESVCVGSAESTGSYLNIPNIISAAEISGADAIHPGYGFLAENDYFAEVCESCGVKFIGPSKEVILSMGDKAQARRTIKKAGVTIIPGSEGVISRLEDAVRICDKVKYPVVIKASAGGGGRGMRVVHNKEALENLILTAQNEAKAAFGKADVYLEKYIEEPRHIEFQILGDHKGDVIYLPERDCSIQRRHQKLIEETPSPSVSEKLRKKMGKAACRVAKTVKYVTAGTVEFLVDKKDNFYFMEMNTRIQVEHPITEQVTGLDLIKEQIRLADGGTLNIDQDDIQIRGHALECRINAEDPNKDFIPAPGQVTQFIPPGGLGVRVDTHLYSGYNVPTYYDSLIAKLITYGHNRQESIEHMQRALDEFVIEGIKTTIPFHQKVLNNAFFRKGEVYTNFIQRRLLGEKT